MSFDIGIFLAALGITLLELAEASAVGLALYGDSHDYRAFLYVALGVIVVFIPTAVVGDLIALLPTVLVQVIGGILLLYFGIRLTKSARRAVLRNRGISGPYKKEEEKGLLYTAFSVGAVEAFEAAIVIVGLLPNNYYSAMSGLVTGMVLVVVLAYILKSQVRKVKQANMKVVIAGLLLTFATFWFGEVIAKLFAITLTTLNDLLLIPLFIVYALIVYFIANRDSNTIVQSSASTVEP